jgi:hypothetical protein
VRVCVALLLALSGVPAQAQSENPTLTLRSGIKFSGSLWDGLETGPKVTQTGKHYIGWIQSKPNASPPPKEIAVVVDGLVNAYLKQQPERYQLYALPGAILHFRDTQSPPVDFIPTGFQFKFKGKLTANTPYYLAKNDPASYYNVRVEWLVDGQFAFVTWLNVFEGKVIEMIADGAGGPPMPRSAFDPPDVASSPAPAKPSAN